MQLLYQSMFHLQTLRNALMFPCVPSLAASTKTWLQCTPIYMSTINHSHSSSPSLLSRDNIWKRISMSMRIICISFTPQTVTKCHLFVQGIWALRPTYSRLSIFCFVMLGFQPVVSLWNLIQAAKTTSSANLSARIFVALDFRGTLQRAISCLCCPASLHVHMMSSWPHPLRTWSITREEHTVNLITQWKGVWLPSRANFAKGCPCSFRPESSPSYLIMTRSN